ncbi:hypothetical protein LJK87_26580 [Paenibacillus sp. P25]|nr:hypothetical protein LJK87_26580 [Paenibacillus sp. P25]
MGPSPFPSERSVGEGASFPPALQAILDRLGTYPAYVIDRHWNVVAWNHMTTTLCGDLNPSSEVERNALWRTFMVEEIKKRNVNWDNAASKSLAHFRSRYALYMNDSWYRELVDKLKDDSETFRQWWERHEVAGNLDGEKVIRHPDGGLLAFRYHTFKISESPEYMMIVYTPVENTGTEEQLGELQNAT